MSKQLHAFNCGMNIEQVRENTLSLNGVTEDQPLEWIRESYNLIASKLPKLIRHKYI